jgi:hypothetical protein
MKGYEVSADSRRLNSLGIDELLEHIFLLHARGPSLPNHLCKDASKLLTSPVNYIIGVLL